MNTIDFRLITIGKRCLGRPRAIWEQTTANDTSSKWTAASEAKYAAPDQ